MFNKVTTVTYEHPELNTTQYFHMSMDEVFGKSDMAIVKLKSSLRGEVYFPFDCMKKLANSNHPLDFWNLYNEIEDKSVFNSKKKRKKTRRPIILMGLQKISPNEVKILCQSYLYPNEKGFVCLQTDIPKDYDLIP